MLASHDVMSDDEISPVVWSTLSSCSQYNVTWYRESFSAIWIESLLMSGHKALLMCTMLSSSMKACWKDQNPINTYQKLQRGSLFARSSAAHLVLWYTFDNSNSAPFWFGDRKSGREVQLGWDEVAQAGIIKALWQQAILLVTCRHERGGKKKRKVVCCGLNGR